MHKKAHNDDFLMVHVSLKFKKVNPNTTPDAPCKILRHCVPLSEIVDADRLFCKPAPSTDCILVVLYANFNFHQTEN